mgnify:CR=1 FL=1
MSATTRAAGIGNIPARRRSAFGANRRCGIDTESAASRHHARQRRHNAQRTVVRGNGVFKVGKLAGDGADA